MGKYRVDISNCVVTTWVDAENKSEAESKLEERIENSIDWIIRGYDTEIKLVVDCPWCDIPTYEEYLVVSANGSTMVCEDCQKRTITFFGRIGTRGRETLHAKYPGKGVSHLQIGDVLQVTQSPIGSMEWVQVRIYEMGDGLFLLERY